MNPLSIKGGVALALLLVATTANATPATVHEWDGFYLGANAGWAWDHRDATIVSSSNGAALANGRTHANGVTGGGQIGFNHIFGPAWLVGAEADLSGADLHSRSVGGGNGQRDDHVKMFGTARARLGYSDGRGIGYVTGGLAWTREDLTRTQISGNFNNATTGTRETSSNTGTGWAVGAGIEHAIFRRVTVKVEYLHIDLGSQSFAFPLSQTRVDANARYDIARIGMNFRL